MDELRLAPYVLLRLEDYQIAINFFDCLITGALGKRAQSNSSRTSPLFWEAVGGLRSLVMKHSASEMI